MRSVCFCTHAHQNMHVPHPISNNIEMPIEEGGASVHAPSGENNGNGHTTTTTTNNNNNTTTTTTNNNTNAAVVDVDADTFSSNSDLEQDDDEYGGIDQHVRSQSQYKTMYGKQRSASSGYEGEENKPPTAAELYGDRIGDVRTTREARMSDNTPVDYVLVFVRPKKVTPHIHHSHPPLTSTTHNIHACRVITTPPCTHPLTHMHAC